MRPAVAVGDQFIVPGHRDRVMIVHEVECDVRGDSGAEDVTIVRSPHGARWSLSPSLRGWLGTPLPADPKAPAP